MAKLRKAALLLSLGLSVFVTAKAHARNIAFTAGWDNFSEPLDYVNSGIRIKFNKTTNTLTITYSLVGATPTKVYQAALAIFGQCAAPPATFGQFPVFQNNMCVPITRQNVSASLVSTQVAAILTDSTGKGATTIAIGPLAAGTYELELTVDNGTGCEVAGGGGNTNCAVDFQSPGPTFGSTIKVSVP